MGGGGGKSSEIDKVSAETKKLLQKLLKSQKSAEKKASNAVSKDTELLKQQMDLENTNTQQMQNLYEQMISQQSSVAEQYKSGLSQQLSLLQQQNSLLGKQSQEQTAYYKSQQDFQKQQMNLQAQQKAKAESEAQYSSMLEAQESRNAGAKANSLLQQVNRRRSLQKFTRRR